MICSKCGKKNSGNAVFCQYCGTKLDNNVANSRNSDTGSNYEANQVSDQLYAANRRQIKMSKWKRVTSIVGVLSFCFMLIFFEPNRRPVGDSLPSLSTTIKTASCQGGLFCLLSSCF